MADDARHLSAGSNEPLADCQCIEKIVCRRRDFWGKQRRRRDTKPTVKGSTMTNQPSEHRETVSAARLHGWDDEKVYFWSPQTGEQCVSDEPALLQKLLAVCAEHFQESR